MKAITLPVLLLAACQTPSEPAGSLEVSDTSDLGRTKDDGGTLGVWDYCDGATPCLIGEGDCDVDAHCDAGLSCVQNLGANFGLYWTVDVCAPSHCGDGVLSGDETAIDFGGSCGGECGGVNGDLHTYCRPGCECGEGEGDCDTDAECAPGLRCVANQGADYGLAATTDVCLPPLTPADLAPGDLVITEIMIDPNAVGDGQGEWFEVYNATGTYVALDGLVVRDNAGLGTFTVTGGITMLPNQYFVFARVNGFAVNGGVNGNYDYPNTHSLANTTDQLRLENAGGTIIDRVDWTTAWPKPVGRSIVLSSTQTFGDNNVAANWCQAAALIPGGAGDFGSPGRPNRACP